MTNTYFIEMTTNKKIIKKYVKSDLINETIKKRKQNK